MFTATELETISQVQVLAMQLKKIDAKVNTKRISVSKQEVALKKVSSSLMKEIDAKTAIERKLSELKRILLKEMKETSVEAPAQKMAHAALEYAELGRDV